MYFCTHANSPWNTICYSHGNQILDMIFWRTKILLMENWSCLCWLEQEQWCVLSLQSSTQGVNCQLNLTRARSSQLPPVLNLNAINTKHGIYDFQVSWEKCYQQPSGLRFISCYDLIIWQETLCVMSMHLSFSVNEASTNFACWKKPHNGLRRNKTEKLWLWLL